ncbi:hypothetical protein LXL04_013888 [Taraxacum kok-saghyz]
MVDLAIPARRHHSSTRTPKCARTMCRNGRLENHATIMDSHVRNSRGERGLPETTIAACLNFWRSSDQLQRLDRRRLLLPSACEMPVVGPPPPCYLVAASLSIISGHMRAKSSFDKGKFNATTRCRDNHNNQIRYQSIPHSRALIPTCNTVIFGLFFFKTNVIFNGKRSGRLLKSHLKNIFKITVLRFLSKSTSFILSDLSRVSNDIIAPGTVYPKDYPSHQADL